MIIFGERGVLLLRYVGTEKLTQPLIGDFTGQVYPFNEKSTMFVDKRDAVFLLGPEFMEL